MFTVFLLIQALAPSLRADAQPAASASDEDVQPWMAGSLEGDVRHRLQVAFPVALKKVRESRSCSALFEQLGADPEEILSSSLYFSAKTSERRLCSGSRSVLAFTTVGSPVTRLCGKFASLRVHEAARLILHEALHHAGLGEAPHTPGAPDSHQINLIVTKGCGL